MKRSIDWLARIDDEDEFVPFEDEDNSFSPLHGSKQWVRKYEEAAIASTCIIKFLDATLDLYTEYKYIDHEYFAELQRDFDEIDKYIDSDYRTSDVVVKKYISNLAAALLPKK